MGKRGVFLLVWDHGVSFVSKLNKNAKFGYDDIKISFDTQGYVLVLWKFWDAAASKRALSETTLFLTCIAFWLCWLDDSLAGAGILSSPEESGNAPSTQRL